MLENIKCNLCNKDNFKVLFETKDYNYNYPGDFKIVKCNNCGLVFLNPRPIDISQFYPDDYLESTENWKEKEKYQLKEQQIRKIEKMKKICKLKNGKNKILDIGCGRGEFLYYLKEKGWECYGVEKQKSGVLYGRENFKLNIFEGDLLNINFSAQNFDIITLWHVIEHLYYPNETLKEINRILKPKGILIMSLPNIDSFQTKISKDKSYHLDVPRHLFFFSPQTIKMMLEKTGFKIFYISFFEGGENNSRTLRLSIRRKYKIFQMKIRFLDMLLYRGSIVLENLAKICKIGGTFEIYAKKEF